jgi:hypothetical protein
LIAAVALAFGNFVTGFAAAIGGKGAADFHAFLELAAGPTADVLFRFAGVNELTARCFARSAAGASGRTACFHVLNR